MTTDTSEKGLETLIVTALTGQAPRPAPTGENFVERPAAYDAGWLLRDASAYDREYCDHPFQFRAFVLATQPKAAEALEPGPHAQRASGRGPSRCVSRSVSRAFTSVCRPRTKALGHTSTRMTERYAKPSDEAMNAIVAALSQRPMDTRGLAATGTEGAGDANAAP